MPSRIILTICIMLALSVVQAQQTSTDTSWKLKYRERGIPVPPFPSALIVAQDGSGDYKTIQEAVNAVRDLSQEQVIIHIRPGIYHEKIIIPSWKKNVFLKGEDSRTTIITHSDYSGKEYPGGKDLFGRSRYSTYTSYTLLVQGADFRAEDLTIENRSGRVGQAVALHVEGDRALILRCRLLGNQDTLYTASAESRQYYRDCYIEGTTDFIFGEATCIFQSCLIKSLSNSYITAAATSPAQQFGYVFMNCRLIADTAVTKCFLGRPWRPHAKTVFMRTEMGAHILAEGWNNWNNPSNESTVLYAEYGNTGLGARNDARVKWSRQLTKKEAKLYTIEKIFKGWDPQKEQPAATGTM
jgi:pectinesterase